jgi:hypothetical protein
LSHLRHLYFIAIIIVQSNPEHKKPYVEAMLQGVAKILKPGAPFLLYGPVMYNGEHTSESNWRFDRWIRSWEKHRGLRDVTWLKAIAHPWGWCWRRISRCRGTTGY